MEVSSTILGSSAKDHPLPPLVATNHLVTVVPSFGAFKEDPPLDPSMVVANLSSSALGVATSLAPS